MKALLLKDFLTLRKYIRTLSVIILLYAVFGIYSGNYSFLTGISIFLTLMLSMATFSYDESANFCSYGLALPITRRQYALSKYLFCLVSLLIIMPCTALVSLAASAISGKMMLGEIIFSAGAVTLISLVYFSAVFPLMFKFGAEKSRIIMLGIFIVPAILILIIGSLQIEIPPITSPQVIFMLAIAAVVLPIACFIGSYFLSVRIVTKKEF